MIPGGRWTKTKDGFPICIVDYPEMIQIPSVNISEEQINAISAMLTEMRKEYDIKIICNDKEI